MATEQLTSILHELQRRRKSNTQSGLDELLKVQESVKSHVSKSYQDRELVMNINLMIRMMAQKGLTELHNKINESYNTFQQKYKEFFNTNQKIKSIDYMLPSKKLQHNQLRIVQLSRVRHDLENDITFYLALSALDGGASTERYNIMINHLKEVPQDYYAEKIAKGKKKRNQLFTQTYKRVILPLAFIGILWTGYKVAEANKEQIVTTAISYMLPSPMIDSIPYFTEEFKTIKQQNEKGRIYQADSLATDLLQRIKNYEESR